jgi:hypothetical protein
LNVLDSDSDDNLIDPVHYGPSGVWLASSKDFQDHFFNGLSTSSNNKVVAQFRYTGLKRKFNDKKGQEEIVTNSTFANHNQDWEIDKYATGDGDSSTNIPYIQELSMRYVPAGGGTFKNWNEK